MRRVLWVLPDRKVLPELKASEDSRVPKVSSGRKVKREDKDRLDHKDRRETGVSSVFPDSLEMMELLDILESLDRPAPLDGTAATALTARRVFPDRLDHLECQDSLDLLVLLDRKESPQSDTLVHLEKRVTVDFPECQVFLDRLDAMDSLV